MDCEKQICPDLVGATVIEHRVKNPEKPCDRYVTVPAAGLDGCAALNLTTGICTIYLDKRANKAAVRHEWGSTISFEE